MTLTPQQQALFLVAMDRQAPIHMSKIAAAAVFFRQLREQFSDGYALLAQLGGPQEEHSRSKYGSEILGFGKYKGQQLSEVPTPYLLWLLAMWTGSTVIYDALSSAICKIPNTLIETNEHLLTIMPKFNYTDLSFDLPPVGVYLAQVTKAEKQIAKSSGNDMIALNLRTLPDSYSLRYFLVFGQTRREMDS